ncbi:MAG: hypothetical protein L0Y68_09565 [Candidatus Dadabacteria bacterium]|nr:hypothetical protein [Candidatus Dadabacteria bacterium]
MTLKALLALASIAITLLGCAHEWQDPNTTIPAKKVDITSILIFSTVYDSAGVIVEGKVWDLMFDKIQEEDREILFTEFKLADQDGYFINVVSPGHIPIAEGDFVQVTGIYRRELSKEKHYYINEIEAIRVEREQKSSRPNY